MWVNFKDYYLGEFEHGTSFEAGSLTALLVRQKKLALAITLWLEVGNGLKLRESAGSGVCPLSTLKDLYEIVRDSDRVLTF